MENYHVNFDASLDVKNEVPDEVTQCSQYEDISDLYDLSHGGVSQLVETSPKIKLETCNTTALCDGEQLLKVEKLEESSLIDNHTDGWGQSAPFTVKVDFETNETDYIASDVIDAEDTVTKVEDDEGSESVLLADDKSENLSSADAQPCVQPDCSKHFQYYCTVYIKVHFLNAAVVCFCVLHIANRLIAISVLPMD